MTIHKGQCLCGAVSFEITNLRTDFGTCHCEMCRRWTGSALLGIEVPDADIRFTGADHIARFQSSYWAERAWCKRCGSSLWYRVTAEGPHSGMYEIPIGLLDDASGLCMTHELFIDEKPDSFAFVGEHARTTRQQFMVKYGMAPDGE